MIRIVKTKPPGRSFHPCHPWQARGIFNITAPPPPEAPFPVGTQLPPHRSPTANQISWPRSHPTRKIAGKYLLTLLVEGTTLGKDVKLFG
ncbi:hypothetical protein GWI33_006431 [Rhynchophorus ferrugineus]|uniref:Uncharacterized protein n=1 Tax=Rhynchophorus ferrugineus TaxID=354439 RepID=A0A834MHC5_RHYFE|nr:hypothetical protein GWI33_006431 [Rhynchophorus ferrugineus]